MPRKILTANRRRQETTRRGDEVVLEVRDIVKKQKPENARRIQKNV